MKYKATDTVRNEVNGKVIYFLSLKYERKPAYARFELFLKYWIEYYLRPRLHLEHNAEINYKSATVTFTT